MQHKCKVTVIDKKLYPELQRKFCKNKESGVCPCYNVGDEFVFERYYNADDFWHIGAGTLVKSGKADEDLARSPGTMHCGEAGVPHCSESVGRNQPLHLHRVARRPDYARLDGRRARYDCLLL